MSCAQVVLATQNNVVNIVPLLMDEFTDCVPIVLSSDRAMDERWTANLEYVLTRKGFKPIIVEIPEAGDSDPELMDRINASTQVFEKVYFNISGGKKNQILPLLRAYLHRNNPNDRLLYADSYPFQLQVLKDMQPETTYESRYLLDLEDILNLHGYTCCPKASCVPSTPFDPTGLALSQEKLDRINSLFLEDTDFAKLIYSYFDRMPTSLDEKNSMEKHLIQLLSEHRPRLLDCRDIVDNGTKLSYDRAAQSIKKLKDLLSGRRESVPTLEELTSLWKELAVIPGVENIFNNYWGVIRQRIINLMKTSLEKKDPVLIKDAPTIARMRELCKSLSGRDPQSSSEIRHSDVERMLDANLKRGMLFENMLNLMVWQVIRRNKPEAVNRLFANIKAYRLDYDGAGKVVRIDQSENANLVEFDLVYVSDHGTLLAFECKTFGLSGDHVKSKTWSATTHAGILSRAVMVTQIQKQHRDNEAEFGSFLPKKVTDQLDSLKKYNSQLWYFDEISEKLAGLL